MYGVDKQQFTKLAGCCSNQFYAMKGRSYADQLALSAKGHLAKIKTLEHLIAYTLLILKSGLTFDLIAYMMDFDQSRAHRQFEKGLNLMYDTLDSEGYLPLRSVARPEEFDAALSGVKTIIIDGTEQRIQRPQDTEEKRLYYSGKKKAHTYKSLIVSDDENYIHYVSYVYVGTSSEISILEEEFDPQFNWFEGYTVRVDLGYVGFDKKYPKAKLFLPNKKPRGGSLTEEQKLENRKLAAKRIEVEHSIGGMKRYDILSIQNRIHKVDSYNQLLGCCAGLWNLNVTS